MKFFPSVKWPIPVIKVYMSARNLKDTDKSLCMYSLIRGVGMLSVTNLWHVPTNVDVKKAGLVLAIHMMQGKWINQQGS